jgi:multicomponent Na+:H+ antiporter subunit G
MQLALDIITAVLVLAGAFFVFVGGLGVMRMPDFYTRTHAASLTDTGGAALILIGLMLQGGLTLAPLKLAAIFLFLFLTSPTASYALANAALLSGLKPLCRNETGEALPDAPLVRLKPVTKKRAKKATAKKAAKKPAKKAVKKSPEKPARKSS